MYKIFHWHAKLIANDLSIDKAFESMHQSVMTKIKNFVSEGQIIKTIVEYGIKTFDSQYRRKQQQRKMDTVTSLQQFYME